MPDERRVRLAWEAPAWDGGSPVTGYEYRHGPVGGDDGMWTRVPDSAADAMSLTVGGLDNGTTYVFELRAVRGEGIAAPGVRGEGLGHGGFP